MTTKHEPLRLFCAKCGEETTGVNHQCKPINLDTLLGTHPGQSLEVARDAAYEVAKIYKAERDALQSKLEAAEAHVMGLQVELLTCREKLKLALEDKAGLLEWNEQARKQLEAAELSNAQMREALGRMRPFAIAYGDHPKRNQQDKLSEVLLQAEQALSSAPVTGWVRVSEVEKTIKVLEKAHRELNEIRARDGVPRTFDGIKSSVDPQYFSSVVDECAEEILRLQSLTNL